MLMTLGWNMQRWMAERLWNQTASDTSIHYTYRNSVETHKLSIVLMHHIITNATRACIFEHATNDGFTAKEVPDFDRYKRKILTSQLQPLPSTSSAPIVQPLNIKTLFANRFAAQTIVQRVLPPGKYNDAEIQQPHKVYAHLHSNRTIILLCDYPMKEVQNVLKAINRPNGILKHK